jgi:DNA-binding transcriptional LysR family regulator
MNKLWIEAFVHVAQTGSASQSAKQLFLTQPSISSRIQSLENDVGQALFIRTDRGMALSEAGKAFLPYAHSLLETWKNGLDAVNELEETVRGKVTVAIIFTAIPFFTRCLNAFCSEYRDVMLAIKCRRSEEVGELVLNREAQIGIVRSLSHPLLQAKRLIPDRCVLVIAADHPLLEDRRGPDGDPLRLPLIELSASASDKEMVAQFSGKCAFRLDIVAESDHSEVCRQFVLAHRGAALLPYFHVSADLQEGRLIELDSFQPDGLPVRHIDMISLKRQDDTRLLATLKSFILTYTSIHRK